MPSPEAEAFGTDALKSTGDAEDPIDPGTSNPLARAYDQRTKQVYDARRALGEAVTGLRTELTHRREEVAALRDERDRAVADNRALRESRAALELEFLAAREELSVLRNMKVVRWAEIPRRFISLVRKLHR